MERSIQLDPDVHSPRRARHFLSGVLEAWNGQDAREEVLLLANELVVNAVRHAATPIEVRIVVVPDAVEVAVRDESPRLPELRRPTPLDESGRGIFTVDAIADDWGVAPESTGKAVWFRLRAPGRETRRFTMAEHWTITESLAELEREGYNAQFGAREAGQVLCFTCRRESHATEVALRHLFRTEGASDPDDMTAVAALSCPRCGARGTIVLTYGPEAPSDDAEVLRLLHDARRK
jgi:anti-sigma regulatory factor (Ser/Thr protein kinase)